MGNLNIKNPTDFANALLGELGAPDTKTNVNNILGWYSAEGGNWNNTAKYNPLNTTQQEPNSTPMQSGSKVQSYTSWQQGLNATVATLQTPGHGYEQILADLNTSQPWIDFSSALKNSSWDGSTHYAGSTGINNGAGTTGTTNQADYTGGANAATSVNDAANSPGKGKKSKDYHGFAGTLQSMDKLYNPTPDSSGVWKFIPNIPSDINSVATMIFVRGTSAMLMSGVILIGIAILVKGGLSGASGGGSPTNVLEFINASQQSNAKLGQSERRLRVQESHEARLGGNNE